MNIQNQILNNEEIKNKFLEREEERITLKEQAISRFKSLLDETGVAYIRTTGDVLFEDSSDKWFTGGSFRVYLSDDSNSEKNVTVVTFYIETQIERYKNKSSPNGYFKIRLGRILKSISREQTKNSILAMYFADEDKFFFKPINLLYKYTEVLLAKKKINPGTDKFFAIRFDPLLDKLNDYEKSFGFIDKENKLYFSTSFYNNSLINFEHENPLYFTELEVKETLKKYKQYDSAWKLKQKTLSKIINRRV